LGLREVGFALATVTCSWTEHLVVLFFSAVI
jgi:hypothetical protein